jgi:hypothetical protein
MRRQLFATRYLIVVPRPLPSAPFLVRRRYLIAVPRQLPAAPLAVGRRCFIVVHKSVLRLLPAATRRGAAFFATNYCDGDEKQRSSRGATFPKFRRFVSSRSSAWRWGRWLSSRRLHNRLIPTQTKE